MERIDVTNIIRDRARLRASLSDTEARVSKTFAPTFGRARSTNTEAQANSNPKSPAQLIKRNRNITYESGNKENALARAASELAEVHAASPLAAPPTSEHTSPAQRIQKDMETRECKSTHQESEPREEGLPSWEDMKVAFKERPDSVASVDSAAIRDFVVHRSYAAPSMYPGSSGNRATVRP